MSADSRAVERWDRWFVALPFIVLAVATLVALLAGPAIGATTPTWRLLAQLGGVVAVAAWLWWCTVLRRELEQVQPWAAVYYVVRTVLALGLTVLNPLFCIFAWVGYIDAHEIFGRRGRWVALAATAFIMATGQSGGLPTGMTAQTALFAGLLVVNLALAGVFSSYGYSVARSNEQRAAMIAELESVNAELEQALTANASLQRTVVAQARTSGVEAERARLAREIHDTIAQSLAGVLAQLQAADAVGDLDAVRLRLARATDLTRDALVDARRSVMDLAPAPLEGGTLAAAVTALVETWSAEHGVRADAVVTGEPRPLHPEIEATVLRIAQEALANVRRHAEARRVGVTLTFDDDEVILDVRDDGVGFEPARAERPTSFGLRGMRQRAVRVAGALEIESATGAGTAVSVRLPALARSAA